LEELKEMIRKKPEDRNAVTPREEVILSTFKVIFGPVYFGPDKEEENEESISSIDRLRNKLIAIRDALNDPDGYYLDIWCDDGYLRPEESHCVFLSFFKNPLVTLSGLLRPEGWLLTTAGGRL
jgi:hypothetical protein